MQHSHPYPNPAATETIIAAGISVNESMRAKLESDSEDFAEVDVV